MSKICVITTISILIYLSTCKQVAQSEPTEFSKDGVFRNKAVVTLSKFWNLVLNPIHPAPTFLIHNRDENLDTVDLRHFTKLLQKIYRNRISEKFLLTEILDF